MPNVCGKVDCVDTRSEIILSCSGVCCKSFHAKCAGLTGTLIDKIKKTNGIHWYCEDCRKISLSALSLQLLKLGAEFFKMSKDFDNLKDAFSAVSATFNKIKSFNDNDVIFVDSTPTLSNNFPIKANTVKISSKNTSPTLLQVGNCSNLDSGDLIALVSPKTVVAESPEVVAPLPQCPAPLQVSPKVVSAAPLNQAIIQAGTSSAGSSSAIVDASPFCPASLKQSNIQVGTSRAGSSSVAVDITPYCPAPLQVSHEVVITAPLSPTPLQAVPKTFTIFISHLIPSTRIEDVQFHIQKLCESNAIANNSIVIKIAAKRCSSFKIITSKEISKLILNPINWPINTLVKEFEFRKKKPTLNQGGKFSKNLTTSQSSTKM